MTTVAVDDELTALSGAGVAACAAPAMMPDINSTPTSTWASFCSGPASGTVRAMPPRRAATTSTTTHTTK